MLARRSLSILSRHPGKSKEERPGSSIAAVTASFVPFHHAENARCTCVSSRETTRGSRTEEKTRWEWKTERKTDPRGEEKGKKKRGITGEGGGGGGVTRLKKRRSSVSPEEKLFGSWSLRRQLFTCWKKSASAHGELLFTPSASDTFSVRLLTIRRVTIRRKRYGEKRGEKKKKKSHEQFRDFRAAAMLLRLFSLTLWNLRREINEN